MSVYGDEKFKKILINGKYVEVPESYGVINNDWMESWP